MKLPDGWEMHSLGELFSSRKEKGIEGLPTLSVTINNGLVERSSIERKTDTNLSPQEHLLIRKGDLAYNMMRMWQGASGLADYDGLVSPAYVVLSPTDRIDSKFAFYWFKSPRMIYLFWAYSYGLTGDRLRLYFKDFTKIKNIIPPLPEQKTIVDLLFTWDEAIEKTERLIQVKEKRFKWLLHSLIGSMKNEKWKKVQLKELCEMSSGGTPKSTVSEYFNGDILWVSIKDMTSQEKYIINTERKLTNLGIINSSAKIFPAGSVLYAMYASLGEVAIAAVDVSTSQAILGIQTKDSLFNEYLFFYLLSIKSKVKLQGQIGTQSNLNAQMVKSMRIPLPPLEEQKQIAETLSSAQQEINLLKQLVEKYKTQKRGLMQKMLTGEWRVKDEIISKYMET
jgi:type I restriction enzyme S subunit